MYLVDTSVWISYLRKENIPCTIYFKKILDHRLSFGMTSIIYQEILQGARSNADFTLLSDYLGGQRFYHPKSLILTHQAAAEIYFKCRQQGITIRSTIDCLIAQIAIEHNLTLLHNDRDYTQIASIIPQLTLANLSE